MPRSWSHAALRRCRSSSASKRLRTTIGSCPSVLERRHREADGVDRAEPGVGDEHDLSGARARRRGRRRRRRSRSATAGRPPSRATPRRRPARASAARRGARRAWDRPAEHGGGHRRRHRHRVGARRRAHDVAGLAGGVAEHVGVERLAVVGVEGLRRLAGRHRATPRRAGRARTAAPDPRLAHLGVRSPRRRRASRGRRAP